MPDIDAASPAGLFSLQVLACMAEYERSLILQRTSAGRQRAAERRAADAENGIVQRGQPFICDMAKQLSSKAVAWKQKLGAAMLPMVRRGFTLREMARRLTADGLTTFKVTYASGKTIGGTRLQAPYLYKVLDCCPAVRREWEAAVAHRAAEHAQEQARLRLREAARERAGAAEGGGQKRLRGDAWWTEKRRALQAPVLLPGYVAAWAARKQARRTEERVKREQGAVAASAPGAKRELSPQDRSDGEPRRKRRR
jgi:hypothetical protein